MPTQNEIRRYITDQIVAALEHGDLPPWRKPWSADKNAGTPSNVVSKKHYSGINPLILELSCQRHQFQSKWFGTMKQWNDLGGRVQRRPDSVPQGRWATQVVYWSAITKRKTDNSGEEKDEKLFFMKMYNLFNLDQVDGDHLDHLRVGNAPVTQADLDSRYEAAEEAIRQIPADIRYGGNRAFFRPSQDYIQLPHRHQFETLDSFYETAGHELVHWTEPKLNWDHGKEGYAKGELRAEIGASFWCAELGLGMGDFDQTCSYLQGWLQAMKSDPSFIFGVSSAASKAVDYLLSFSRAAEPVEGNEALVV